MLHSRSARMGRGVLHLGHSIELMALCSCKRFCNHREVNEAARPRGLTSVKLLQISRRTRMMNQIRKQQQIIGVMYYKVSYVFTRASYSSLLYSLFSLHSFLFSLHSFLFSLLSSLFSLSLSVSELSPSSHVLRPIIGPSNL